MAGYASRGAGARLRMANSISRCPKCDTTFRVTDAQLLVANGKVRCGTCLRIFDATELMLDVQCVDDGGLGIVR